VRPDPSAPTQTVRLGSRGSALALVQSRSVAAALEAASGMAVELEVIHTRGDKVLDKPLPEIGGKGLFTEELDRALLEGRIDLAVHSLKDLPTDTTPGLSLACVPPREDPRDVLVGPRGDAVSLRDLPPDAVVGTSSLRRRALLAAFRPDLRALDVRGNLDTRLRKLDEGRYDALLLASAGLKRLGLAHRVGEWLERTSWLPAPGQGALAVVTRADDRALRQALGSLHDEDTAAAVAAERALLARLEGGCQIPVGALALPFEGGLRLWGLVVSPDGRRAVRGDLTGAPASAEELGRSLAEVLLERGADEILTDLKVVNAPSHP
jgi:hydroxymethylbilane synthase